MIRAMNTEKITAEKIKAMKGEKIAALTAYDFPMTRLLDEVGVPLILVGDSVGMVVLGYQDTISVTMEEMEHHVRAAARAKPRGLLAADLPYHSYENVTDAIKNALRLIAAGAEAVKAEGGRAIEKQVQAIVKEGIPFLGISACCRSMCGRKAVTMSKASWIRNAKRCWMTRARWWMPGRSPSCSNWSARQSPPS